MVVGLTGGIGSGKTTVLNQFKGLGISTYIADVEAKRLMNTNALLKNNIKALLGNDSYVDGVLNRGFVAEKIFKNKELLKKINDLVHPAVHQDFVTFCDKHKKHAYIIYESAILLQSKYSVCDKVIVVTASTDIRVARVLERENHQVNREDVLSRMNNQLSQEKMIRLSDFQIKNDMDILNLKTQVEKIHQILINKKDKDYFKFV